MKAVARSMPTSAAADHVGEALGCKLYEVRRLLRLPPRATPLEDRHHLVSPSLHFLSILHASTLSLPFFLPTMLFSAHPRFLLSSLRFVSYCPTLYHRYPRAGSFLETSWTTMRRRGDTLWFVARRASAPAAITWERRTASGLWLHGSPSLPSRWTGGWGADDIHVGNRELQMRMDVK